MTPARYREIEAILDKAEAIFVDYPPVSPAGKAIEAELRNLLVKVVAERHRQTILQLKRSESEHGSNGQNLPETH